MSRMIGSRSWLLSWQMWGVVVLLLGVVCLHHILTVTARARAVHSRRGTFRPVQVQCSTQRRGGLLVLLWVVMLRGQVAGTGTGTVGMVPHSSQVVVNGPPVGGGGGCGGVVCRH
jgi:hypothetical protein